MLATIGALLLSADMVEKDVAATVRDVIGVEIAVRSAIGLMDLLMTPERERRFREAVLHNVRLKADILQLACYRAGRRQCSSREKGVSYYALLRKMLVLCTN